jgi:hypothetical protein
MDQFQFWKNWPQQNRMAYILMLGLFCIGIIVYFVAYYVGPDAIIRWQTMSILETVPVKAQDFFVGLFNFSVEAENFVVKDFFRGSPLVINPVFSYLYLSILIISFSFILGVLPSLGRIFFGFTMAAVVAALFSFRFDQLLIFGLSDNTILYIVIFLILGLSTYFHVVRPDKSLIKRFGGFLSLFILIAIVIVNFSQVQNPFLYLANYGILASVILSVLIIFTVAHEIIYGFIFLVTKANTSESKNSAFHFSIISTLYLVNVLLVYLKNERFIEFDFLYINAFWLVIISLLLGIWGYKIRTTQADYNISFYPEGAFLYLSLGLVYLATASYIFVSGNDPLVEAFEDVIIFSHLGFGLLFVLYIIANFLAPLLANYKVYKVAYQPMRMPFFTARLAGFIAVLAFFFKSDMVALSQALSGYYNGLGDIKLVENKIDIAREYYLYGAQLAYRNHRSNYALGYFAEFENESTNAIERFKTAVQKNPTPYAYVNLSNIYFDSGLYFDALFSLKEGLNKFPDNAPIKHNLGRLFDNLNVLDSALLYYDAASRDNFVQNSAKANILEMIVRYNFTINSDSIRDEYSDLEYFPLKINTLAVLNHAGKRVDAPFEEQHFSDSTLNVYNGSYLYNFQFNQKAFMAADAEKLIAFARYPGNYYYAEKLEFLSALIYYNRNQYYDAFFTMIRIKDTYSARQAQANEILGKWYLHQGAPNLAIEHFQLLADQEQRKNVTNYAIALTEAGKLDRAIRLWIKLDATDTLSDTNLDMTTILDANVASAESFSDENIYQFIRYQKENLSDEEVVRLTGNIKSGNLRAMALIDHIYHNLRNRNHVNAAHHKDLLNGIEVTNKIVSVEREWLNLHIDHALQNFESLRRSLEEIEIVPNDKNIDYLLFRGILAERAGNMDEAQQYYIQITENTPFHELALRRALEFLKEKNEVDIAYQALVNAVQFNTHSPELQKLYILSALDLRLVEYAKAGMDHLQEITSPNDYQEFQQRYHKRLEEINNLEESWQ